MKLLVKIINNTKLGYLEAYPGDGIDLAYPVQNKRRGKVQPQTTQTLTTGASLGVLVEYPSSLVTYDEEINLTHQKNHVNKVKLSGLTFIDLFSGIGGFRLGLERAGHKCVGFVEIDKYARKSYEAMHNTEGEWTRNDITAITNEEWRELRGKVDIIAGGFPCQAFSIAGKRGGFDDTRGTLFFDIARAAKEIQPSYLFLENVKGLFSHDQGRTFGTIIQTLDELGYVVEWGLFNSKFWGVPQNRERVFIVATRKDVFEQPILFNLLKQQEVNGVQVRLRDVLETNVDEKFYLSEEQTERLVFNMEKRALPDSEIKILGTTNPDRHNDADVLDVSGISPTLSARDYKGPKQVMVESGLPIREATKTGYSVAKDGDSVNLQFPDSKTRRGRVENQIANTLQAGEANQGVVTGYLIRKLTPKECFRLQGFPDELFEKAKEVNSNSQLYKQAGNSVTVNVIQTIARELKLPTHSKRIKD